MTHTPPSSSSRQHARPWVHCVGFPRTIIGAVAIKAAAECAAIGGHRVSEVLRKVIKRIVPPMLAFKF